MSPWVIWWIIWQQTWGKKPMETQQCSTEYNFQGVMYFFRREKVQCRYQFSLRDAVDNDKEKAAQYAELLYSQALLIAGLPLEDPAKYTELVCSLMV